MIERYISAFPTLAVNSTTALRAAIDVNLILKVPLPLSNVAATFLRQEKGQNVHTA